MLSEYGILHGLDCPKYDLTEEYYFNIIDGTLLIAEYMDVFDHNQYCVDYYMDMELAPLNITDSDYKVS
jgi:hypothetical protein